MRRPRKQNIENVVRWLESIDISLYGPYMDTETGEEFGSLMDYDVKAAIKRYDHIKNATLFDKLWQCKQNGEKK